MLEMVRTTCPGSMSKPLSVFATVTGRRRGQCAVCDYTVPLRKTGLTQQHQSWQDEAASPVALGVATPSTVAPPPVAPVPVVVPQPVAPAPAYELSEKSTQGEREQKTAPVAISEVIVSSGASAPGAYGLIASVVLAFDVLLIAGILALSIAFGAEVAFGWTGVWIAVSIGAAFWLWKLDTRSQPVKVIRVVETQIVTAGDQQPQKIAQQSGTARAA